MEDVSGLMYIQLNSIRVKIIKSDTGTEQFIKRQRILRYTYELKIRGENTYASKFKISYIRYGRCNSK